MRKITADAVRAFRNRQTFKRGNTQVKVFDNSVALYLHGNMIAEYAADGALYINDGGWQSNTTKERLNGLPNVRIHQKNFQWYLNDKAWSGEWTLI
tara:strand:+ start:76 stop:363 length:288 start_codon:yes stop_codon:yes gene_type:complete